VRLLGADADGVTMFFARAQDIRRTGRRRLQLRLAVHRFRHDGRCRRSPGVDDGRLV
jgi:hypothetical protein